MVPCSTQCWSLKDLQLPAAVLFLGVHSHAARKLSSPCHKPSNSTQHPDECVCMADLVHTTTEDPSKTVPQALAGPQLSHVNATRHFTVLPSAPLKVPVQNKPFRGFTHRF